MRWIDFCGGNLQQFSGPVPVLRGGARLEEGREGRRYERTREGAVIALSE